MPTYLPVTLVIPILNESKSLPELFHAIERQTHRPNEIIFSDAGSTDDSLSLIEAWWCQAGWENANCRVLSRPGAMPGAGRNAGMRAARNDWIAFTDGGITPATDWLEQLYRHALETQVQVVLGVSHFSAKAPFAKAVCALSYGHGAFHPVIPASLFDRRVFAKIGDFPEHLRAGEDLILMAALRTAYGASEVCEAAQVSYSHFPTDWRQAIRKWRVTEFHCVLGRVRMRQQLLYLFGLPAVYLMVGLGNGFGVTLFVIYLLLRGIIDPIRRSPDRPWWGSDPRAAFIAPPLAAMLDLAKWAGIVQGIGVRLAARTGLVGNRPSDSSNCR